MAGPIASMPDHGRWPVVTAGLAPASALAWLATRHRLDPDVRWQWAAMPVLTAHQFEEWVWPNGFLEWLNEDVFACAEPGHPLSARIGFVVNVPFGWGVSVAASILGDRVPALPILVCVSHLGNAALHLGWAVRHRRWDPGAVTAAVVLTPWAVAGLRRRVGRRGAPVGHQLVGVGGGVASAVALFATLRRRAALGR